MSPWRARAHRRPGIRFLSLDCSVWAGSARVRSHSLAWLARGSGRRFPLASLKTWSVTWLSDSSTSCLISGTSRLATPATSRHESVLAAAAVATADDVLVVAAADPLSVHHAQLATEDAGAVLDAEHTWLVLNRCDGAEDAVSSVAALKLPLAAVLPTDK